MDQTPALSLHQIADTLWLNHEQEAYRALLLYIKERNKLLALVAQLKEGDK